MKTTHKTTEETIHIQVEKGEIEGELIIPPEAQGIVLFAHGSGSSRFSPRNQLVAKIIREHHLATLLLDLLTLEEDRVDQVSREFRFNIDLLADRLLQATQWIFKDSRTQNLSIGYFGSSTGAAAALIAAAKVKNRVSAVVSRGGRPDLAHPYLSEVKAPTLLIVGGYDTVVIQLNQEAYEQLSCEKRLDIVPKATHLFEETGALEQVAHLACNWFTQYLGAS